MLRVSTFQWHKDDDKIASQINALMKTNSEKEQLIWGAIFLIHADHGSSEIILTHKTVNKTNRCVSDRSGKRIYMKHTAVSSLINNFFSLSHGIPITLVTQLQQGNVFINLFFSSQMPFDIQRYN